MSTVKETSSGKAKFFEPPNILRQKVGFGGIDPASLQKAEAFILENELDFQPVAEDLILQLDIIISQAKTGKISSADSINSLTKVIMELKANGGMFQYPLLSEVAGVVLNFLENIEVLDKNVFEILDAHQNTIAVIVKNKLKGTGGTEGKALANELYKACRRYYERHNVEITG